MFSFSDAVLEMHFIEFFTSARLYCEEVNSQKKGAYELVPDPETLYSTVVATYHDIARYKYYHQDDPNATKSDAVKRSAYFIKWILKFRPLMIRRELLIPPTKPSPMDHSLFVNERFAIERALDMIASELGIQAEVELSKNKLYHTLYDFHFRELGVDSLLSMCQWIYDMCQHKAKGGNGTSAVLDFGVQLS